MLTYPPEQVLLGGRVQHIRYLQVGINTESVLRSSGGGGPSRGAVRFVSLRPRFHMRIINHFQAEEETN